MNHGVLFKISIFSDMFKFITSLDICFLTIFILLVSYIFQILPYSENVTLLKISSYVLHLCRKTLRFHSQLPPKHWTQKAR